jgi:MFS family permease
VALLAIGNATGRIIAGMLSDRIGRIWTMFIIFLFQAGLMMVLRTGLTDMIAFVIVSMLLGFNYGACPSVFPPAAVKDNFGLKSFGINYWLVFTAWGVGGFVRPLFAGKLFEAARDRQLQRCQSYGCRGAHLRYPFKRATPQGAACRNGDGIDPPSPTICCSISFAAASFLVWQISALFPCNLQSSGIM